MMDFLRGLVPRRDRDSSWAAPALPSRFSGLRPISVEAPGCDAPAGVVADSARESSPQDLRGAALMQQLQSPSNRPASNGLPVVAPTPPDHPVPATYRHHHHERLAVERVLTPVALPLRVGGIIMRPAMPAPVGQATVLRTEMPAVEARPKRPVARRQPLPQTAMVSAPLSAAAVAERKATQTNPRPVIHVTIDRIEVRAPATTRPAARPGRTRETAPTVSLKDYLRGPGNRRGPA
jgi:hypothetical protein